MSKGKHSSKLPIASILLAMGAVFAWWEMRCPREIDLSIGAVESKEAGLRAAIQRLAAEIQLCPQAEIYRITWSNPTPYEQSAYGALIFHRPAGALGYEHDTYSGISGLRYIVDDAAIKTVAEQGGTLEDFARYAKQIK